MAELFVIKTQNGQFIPACEDDWEIAKKYKVGEMYRARIDKPRNLKFLQKFMVLISVIFEIQTHFNNKEALRYWLIMKAGHFDLYVVPNGTNIYIPKSISFANMDEVQFSKVYNDVINVALGHEKICAGNTQEEIDEQVNLILGFT